MKHGSNYLEIMNVQLIKSRQYLCALSNRNNLHYLQNHALIMHLRFIGNREESKEVWKIFIIKESTENIIYIQTNTPQHENIYLYIYTYNYWNMHGIDYYSKTGRKFILLCLFNINTHSCYMQAHIEYT